MATSSVQTGNVVRKVQHTRSFRPSQRLLTANDFSAPIKVFGRKRVIIKEEVDDEEIPVLVKQKYDHDNHPQRHHIHSQKTRETGSNNGYMKANASTYSNSRCDEFGLEDEEDYEVFYDQLPPRLSNTPKIQAHAKPRKQAFPIVNMGKAVVTGRKEILSQEIDIQQLIEKYVNSDTQKETEAWLINIALSEKLNSMNREMDRMRGEMAEMWECLNQQLKSREGMKDRFTLQTPWPGESGSGAASLMPTPFGANPAPIPVNERDYIVPALYAKNEVDCRVVYNAIQRKGKKRPGVVFLTYFIRDLCALAIEPPHKFLLTIRTKNRKDDLVNCSTDFMRPIEAFFLAACNVTSGLTYALGDMLREALAHELRELRRNPRKEKVTLDDNLMRVLKNIGWKNDSLLEDENGHVEEPEEEEEGEERHDMDEHVEDEMMVEEEVEVEDDD